MQLKLERGHDVRLPDKRSLKGLKWTMELKEGADIVGITEKEEPIGVLSYYKEWSGHYDFIPEQCHIQAVINREIFNALLSAIQAGRLPDLVSVSARGLEYGWEPDGAVKTWDVKAFEHTHVTKVWFSILLAASNTESSVDSSSSESIAHLPASSADIQGLRSHITEQIALLTHTVWQALAYLLGAAFLFWIFHALGTR